MTSAVITEVLGAAFLALKPEERWGAAREFTLDFTLERWMIVVGMIALIALGALLLWRGFSRAKEGKKAVGRSFADNARALGLTGRESRLLTIAADRAGLKREESIFTMDTAFERGTTKVIEDGLGSEQSAESAEEREQLKIEFSFLREKLGFGKQRSSSAGKKLSSRQIPVGKTLYITRRKARDSDDIESTVVKNSASELVIKVSKLVRVTFGETWCVRYYSGVSVWEFDTTVVSCDGDVLVLKHSERVRFINRRRFLRVSVRRRAFIAQFPFARTIVKEGAQREEQGKAAQDLPEASGRMWGPPKFVPAIVTELAGPGLRMESALEVKVGQRVLVVFILDEEDGRDSAQAPEGDKTAAPKIVQDIGEVRHSRAVEKGFSIAVELTGLSDSDADELVLVSNAASLKSGAGDKDVPPSAESEERVLEPAAAQGE